MIHHPRRKAKIKIVCFLRKQTAQTAQTILVLRKTQKNRQKTKKMCSNFIKGFVAKYDKMFNTTLNETRLKMFFLNLTHNRCFLINKVVSEVYENFELGIKIKNASDYGHFESRVLTLMNSFVNDVIKLIQEKISLYLIPRNFEALQTINEDLHSARDELYNELSKEVKSRIEGDDNEIFELFRYSNSKRMMLKDILGDIKNSSFWKEKNVTIFTEKYSKQMVKLIKRRLDILIGIFEHKYLMEPKI